MPNPRFSTAITRVKGEKPARYVQQIKGGVADDLIGDRHCVAVGVLGLGPEGPV
jgi:hypothetical protein